MYGCFHDFTEQQKQVTYEAVLERHGPTLRSLSPPTTQSLADVRELLTRCPQLRHLDLTIARIGGDAEEVATYRQLGSHPRLRSIELALDCAVDASTQRPSSHNSSQTTWYDHQRLFAHSRSNIMSIPLPSSKATSKVSSDHLRQSFIACALDSTLAQAIFRQITTAKPINAAPIEVFAVKVLSAGTFRFSPATADLEPRSYNPIFDRYFGCLAWTMTPHPNVDRAGEVIVEQRIPADRERFVREPFGLEGLEPVFRTLWPEGDTGNWMDEWQSLPLAE
jgi:hypothetical protein